MGAMRAGVVVSGAVGLLLTLLTNGAAFAHGSMADPISRVYHCYKENPERPESDACQAAVAVNGTQPFYDWMAVRIANANGRHRQIIPDGELCSAGNEKYAGLDLARADWYATTLPSGGEYTFKWRVTAQHVGTFKLYVTDASYDPTEPLTWSDLEPEPFLVAKNPPVSNGYYLMHGQLPEGKHGRHLIYAIWQRSDSPEAFYSCSDVIFTSDGAAAQDPPVGNDPVVHDDGANAIQQEGTAHAHGSESAPSGGMPASEHTAHEHSGHSVSAEPDIATDPVETDVLEPEPAAETTIAPRDAGAGAADSPEHATGELAYTGSNTLPYIATGGGMLVVGALAFVLTRDRRLRGRRRLLRTTRRQRP